MLKRCANTAEYIAISTILSFAKVLAAVVLLCSCATSAVGEAAPPVDRGPKPGREDAALPAPPPTPPAPRDFLQPPPPAAVAQPPQSQGRALPDSAHETSIAQRVARWFFSPDGPQASPQEIQERKPPHGSPSPGYGPPQSSKYGPPKSFNQYGPPKGSNHGPPPGDYGPPKLPSGHYGPPKPVPLHNGSPQPSPRRPLSARYAPPKPPVPHLGPPPPSSSHHGPPSGQYGLPKSPPPAYGPPAGHGISPNGHGPPPPPPAPPSNHRPSPAHRPPPGHSSPPNPNKARDCNPCNKVPWIPMSRTPAGVSDQVLSLVTPPEAHAAGQVGQYLPPGPSQGKIPPFQPLKPLSGDYGPPAPGAEQDGQYNAPAAHGDLPLGAGQAPGNAYGPPAGAGAPTDNYGPPPPAPAHFAAGAGPGIGGHGGSGQLAPAPSEQYSPPRPPPHLQLPARPHGDYVPPAQLQPPSAPLPPPHHAPGGGALPVALAPSFLPAPPVHNARPFHGPADYLTPPGGNAGHGQSFLDPATQHHGFGSGPSGSGPALSAPGQGSGPGGDLDVLKSVSVYSESHPAAQHALGSDQHGNVYNGDPSPVHLVPDQQGPSAADQLHLPSGDNDHEAPSSEGGNQIITHEHAGNQHNGTDNSLEVIKSVRVADFLSSVEYPPEIVQSPYIDLTPPPSGNKDQYSTTFNHAYNGNLPHEEIIVGRPAVDNVNDNRNLYQQTSASENSSPVKEQLQHHLETNHGLNSELPEPNESSSSLTYHQTHSNHHYKTDLKSSSTNKDAVNGPSAPSHSSLLPDLNLSGNNLYPSGNIPGSIIRNEEHPSQGLSKNVSSTHSPLEIHSQSQDQVHVITGNEERLPSRNVGLPSQGIQTSGSPGPHGLAASGSQGVLMSPSLQSTSAPQNVGTQGTQSSVIVDIQPSLQTSAQGASLIYQINGLNTQQSQYQHAYTNTPAQTSVFVSFQHTPQKPFNYAPPSLLNQQLPPPAPFQNTFHSPPQSPPAGPPAAFGSFQGPYQPEAPVTYLNPPRNPFKNYNAATPAPVVDAPPLAESHSHPSWTSAAASGAHTPPKVESDKAYLAGLVPPPLPRPVQTQAGTGTNESKRTKQIQIIVPYTSSKDLIQFRFPGANPDELDATGWSPIANPDPASNQGRIVPGPNNCSDIIADGSIDSSLWQEQVSRCRGQLGAVGQSIDPQDDYHHQESRRVTAKTPLTDKLPANHKNKPFAIKPNSQNGEIQHIFASNIRDLLRGEVEARPTADTINLLKLQKNIDEWTALEFSKHKHLHGNHKSTDADNGFTAPFATGTTLHHLRLPSKQIPEEYLTTTPLSVDDTDQTINFSPTIPPGFTFNDISRTSPSSLFFDHEISGSNTHSITASAAETPSNVTHGGIWNQTSHDATWKFFESNLVLPEAVTVTTTMQPPTTTEEFTHETIDATEPTVQANWDHLEVSISPITKEKVYVVTPLPTWVAPSPSSTPSAPRFTSSGIYQAVSRSPTTARPSPTSINDIIPFRKSVLSPADMLGVSPFPFHSPRFLIRPTPGPSLHRLFTMKASEAGYTIPSLSPILDDADDVDEEVADASITEGNSVHDTYALDGHTGSTAAPANATGDRGHSAALLGLASSPTYTPPEGARVLTYSGHSKVVTAVTPPTLVTPKKKLNGLGEKKTSTTAAAKATPSTTPESELPSSTPAPPTDAPAPAVGDWDFRPLRADTEAYLWHFPELLADGDELHEEDVAAVREAALELQKEKRS